MKPEVLHRVTSQNFFIRHIEHPHPPPPLSFLQEGVEPPTKFSKKGGLTGYELAACTSQNAKVFQVSAKLFPRETTKMGS